MAVLVFGLASPVSLALAGPAQAQAEEAPSALQREGLLDLNAATAADLEALPGIGPAKAQAILELRQRRQRFRRVDDLLRVRGIGPATLKKLKPLLTVAAP